MLASSAILLLLLPFAGSLAGYGAGVVFLGFALTALLQSAFPQNTLQLWIAAYAFALAFPLTAYTSGALLDRFCFGEGKQVPHKQRAVFGLLLLALTFSLCFQIGPIIGFVNSLQLVLSSGSALKLGAFFAVLGSAVLFCAGAMAFCVMFVILAFELSARWLIGASGSQSAVSFQALRSLLTIVLIALAFNGAMGLMLAELRPSVIIQQVLSG